MGLRVERIPTFGDNYTYLIVCEDTGEAAIVDAPEDAGVIRRVEETGANVVKILSTHHHPDHSMANPKLAEKYGAPVLGHASDSGRLPGQTDGLEEGDTVTVGNQTARVLFIPAHTAGHIAYVFDEAEAVFSGDTLFAGGCGRLFTSTPRATSPSPSTPSRRTLPRRKSSSASARSARTPPPTGTTPPRPR
ncbi:MAG: MBL fold metallo-hydrolase [Deltaproteobacteria bacterium]|nr:MBL fold metallo-hydrolase [Deltaproteobacteria bacterium]